jgi:hypothetical protein
MLRRFCFMVLLLTGLALAGCGGDPKAEQASSASDVNSLLRQTFSNLDEMRSAQVDLKVRIEPRGAAASEGPVSARLTGPFATQGPGKLPKFAFNAKLQSGGRTVSGGATYTGEKGYITLQGTPYEVSGLVLRQFVAGYEQALKSRKGGGGLVLGSLGIDFTKWLPDARNEGQAKVGDADTIKITGSADVDQVIADLDKIAERAQALNLPGASGKLPQRLTPEQKRAAAAAVKGLDVTVYTGADDRILRRLVVSADLKDAGSEVDAAIRFDVTFTKVGEDQSFPAPADAKPFSELLKAVDAAGLGNLGALGGGGAAGGGEAGGGAAPSANNVDKYAKCIEQADGDSAKARKCAALLSGG